ncbi:hypothetical protein [Clostridium sp.]|nr:hypothetical protein [Clostridium sp.]
MQYFQQDLLEILKLGLMKQYANSNFVVDARNGFDYDKADIEGGI